MSNMNEPIVPSLDRALTVLEYIAQARDPVSIKSIVTDLQFPHTSVFRIVKQLAARNYIQEDSQRTSHFRLGLQILTLANGMTYINDLRQVANSELYSLAIKSKQVVQLGIIRDYSVTYIEQITPPNPVLLYTDLYSILPINISAAGKVLTAFATPSEREYILSNTEFHKATVNTIDNRKDLLVELSKVSGNGFAFDNEEYAIGIGCLAAPIFNHEIRCVAAVGLTGAISNYQGESKEHLVDLLTQSARNISLRLGLPKSKA